MLFHHNAFHCSIHWKCSWNQKMIFAILSSLCLHMAPSEGKWIPPPPLDLPPPMTAVKINCQLSCSTYKSSAIVFCKIYVTQVLTEMSVWKPSIYHLSAGDQNQPLYSWSNLIKTCGISFWQRSVLLTVQKNEKEKNTYFATTRSQKSKYFYLLQIRKRTKHNYIVLTTEWVRDMGLNDPAWPATLRVMRSTNGYEESSK